LKAFWVDLKTWFYLTILPCHQMGELRLVLGIFCHRPCPRLRGPYYTVLRYCMILLDLHSINYRFPLWQATIYISKNSVHISVLNPTEPYSSYPIIAIMQNFPGGAYNPHRKLYCKISLLGFNLVVILSEIDITLFIRYH